MKQENKDQSKINECFEEIKMVLKKYGCGIYGMHGNDVVIYNKNNQQGNNYYSEDFDK